MAAAINLASMKNPAALRQRVVAELLQLRKQGLEVSLCETRRGQLTFLGCNIVQNSGVLPPDQAQGLLRCFLANALADIIITHCEENLVHKLVQREYRTLSLEDRQKIIDLTLKKEGDLLPTPADRHARIVRKLVDYLKYSNTIIVEGFVRFRLQDYRRELQEAVGRAANDVEGEKEYLEFIQLLRYFVSLQEPQWSQIQVLLDSNGSFQLLDEQSRPLRLGNFWDGFGPHDDLTHADLLVSALVCMAPATIILHLGTSADLWFRDLITTIHDIFPGQVITCSGCPLCRGT